MPKKIISLLQKTPALLIYLFSCYLAITGAYYLYDQKPESAVIAFAAAVLFFAVSRFDQLESVKAFGVEVKAKIKEVNELIDQLRTLTILHGTMSAGMSAGMGYFIEPLQPEELYGRIQRIIRSFRAVGAADHEIDAVLEFWRHRAVCMLIWASEAQTSIIRSEGLKEWVEIRSALSNANEDFQHAYHQEYKIEILYQHERIETSSPVKNLEYLKDLASRRDLFKSSGLHDQLSEILTPYIGECENILFGNLPPNFSLMVVPVKNVLIA